MRNGYCPTAKSEEWDVVVLEEADQGRICLKVLVDYCNKWEAFYMNKKRKIFLIVLESDPGNVLEFTRVELMEFVKNFNKPKVILDPVALTG